MSERRDHDAREECRAAYQELVRESTDEGLLMLSRLLAAEPVRRAADRVPGRPGGEVPP